MNSLIHLFATRYWQPTQTQHEASSHSFTMARLSNSPGKKKKETKTVFHSKFVGIKLLLSFYSVLVYAIFVSFSFRALRSTSPPYREGCWGYPEAQVAPLSEYIAYYDFYLYFILFPLFPFLFPFLSITFFSWYFWYWARFLPLGGSGNNIRRAMISMQTLMPPRFRLPILGTE